MFLELNGYILKMDMDVVDVAIRIATHEIEFDQFITWLKNRSVEF